MPWGRADPALRMNRGSDQSWHELLLEADSPPRLRAPTSALGAARVVRLVAHRTRATRRVADAGGRSGLEDDDLARPLRVLSVEGRQRDEPDRRDREPDDEEQQRQHRAGCVRTLVRNRNAGSAVRRSGRRHVSCVGRTQARLMPRSGGVTAGRLPRPRRTGDAIARGGKPRRSANRPLRRRALRPCAIATPRAAAVQRRPDRDHQHHPHDRPHWASEGERDDRSRSADHPDGAVRTRARVAAVDAGEPGVPRSGPDGLGGSNPGIAWRPSKEKHRCAKCIRPVGSPPGRGLPGASARDCWGSGQRARLAHAGPRTRAPRARPEAPPVGRSRG